MHHADEPGFFALQDAPHLGGVREVVRRNLHQNVGGPDSRKLRKQPCHPWEDRCESSLPGRSIGRCPAPVELVQISDGRFARNPPIEACRMDGGESKLGPVQAKQSTRIGHLYAVYAGGTGMPHARNQPRYIQNNTGHR